MSLWNEVLPVMSYESASVALAEDGLSKRVVSESRLRLHTVQWEDLLSQLMLSDKVVSVDLCIEHLAFRQLCRMLELEAQEDFLLSLPLNAVIPVLTHYTGRIKPLEVKIYARKMSVRYLSGRTDMNSVKSVVSSNGKKVFNLERWLYTLTLLEQYRWKSHKVLVQEDTLLALYRHETEPIMFKQGDVEVQGMRGLALMHSSAGFYPTRIVPVLFIGDVWLPIGDHEFEEGLTQDLNDLCDGVIGMFGAMPHYLVAQSTQVSHVLSAHATVTIDKVQGCEMLIHNGFTKQEAVKKVAALGQVTGYSTVMSVMKALQNKLYALTSEQQFSRIVKLGLSLWQD